MEVNALLAKKYPFGRETEASNQLLLRSFCNHLLLGQFEICRACYRELKDNVLSRSIPIRLINIFIKNCLSKCTFHNQLGWALLREIEETPESFNLINELKSLLETVFIIDLFNLSPKDCEINRLDVIKAFRDVICSDTDILPEYTLSLLSSCVQTQPSEFVYLLKLHADHTKLFHQLLEIIVNTLYAVIITKQQSEQDNRELLKSVLHVYKTENSELNEKITEIFGALLRSVTDKQTWSQIQEFIHSAILSNAEPSALLALLSSAEKQIFTQISHQDKEIVDYYHWRDRMHQCITHQLHFFSHLLNEADALIKSSSYSELVKVFNNGSYKPLLPLIFQIAWPQCDSSAQRSQLITAFSDPTIKVQRLYDIVEQYQTVNIIAKNLAHVNQKSAISVFEKAPVITAKAIGCQSVLQSLLLLVDDITTDWSFDMVIDMLKSSGSSLIPNKPPRTSDDTEQQYGPSELDIYKGFHCLYQLVKTMLISRNSKLSPLPNPTLPKAATEIIANIRPLLTTIQPISFQLEVLENCFCLLFLQRSDLPSDMTLDTVHKEKTNSGDDLYFSAKESILVEKVSPQADSSTGEDIFHTKKMLDVGFIVSPAFIRESLNLMKAVLNDVDNALNDETGSQRTTLTARSVSLQQKVTEAFWRLQLVESCPEPGTSKPSEINDIVKYEHVVLPTLHTKVGGAHAGQKSFRFVSQSQSEGTGDSDSSPSPSIKSSQTKSSKASRRGRLRQINNQQTVLSRARGSFICRMLQSPADLVYMCIKYDNLKQAHHVLQLYNLQDTPVAQEIKLIEILQKKSESPMPVLASSSSFSLSSIRSAAQTSLNSLSNVDSVSTLALQARQPNTITELSEQKLKQNEGLFHPVLAPAMVFCDVLSTCYRNSQSEIENQLVNYMNTNQHTLSTLNSNFSPGFLGYLKFIEKLSANKISSPILASQSDYSYINNLLLSSYFKSLEPTDIQKRCQQFRELETLFDLTKSSIAQRKLDLEALIEVLATQYPDNTNYLRDFHQQLLLLYHTMRDKTAEPGLELSAVLRDGPTMIMGRLLFEYHVPPSSLAIVADMMKLDLSHVIVRSCCPPIKCKSPRSKQRRLQRSVSMSDKTFKLGYRCCLSGEVENKVDFELKPLEIVHELLERLLKLVAKHCPVINSQKSARSLTCTPEYREFSIDCVRLQEVDMSRVTDMIEKCTLLVNVHNLLCLHGIIEYYAHTVAASPSLISSTFHLTSCCYQLGQLGVINLFEIQQFLLSFSTKGSVLHIEQLELSLEHPWFDIGAGITHDLKSRCCFLLYDGTKNFQAITPVTPNTLERTSWKIRQLYLSHSVKLSPDCTKLELPQKLINLQSYLLNKDIANNSYSHLIEWLKSLHPAWNPISELVTSCDELSEIVTVVPDSNVLIYLSESGPDLDLTLSGSYESVSTDHEFTSSFQLTSADVTLQQADFNISPTAIKYLRERSPIITMLLDLVYDKILEYKEETDQTHYFSHTNLCSDFPYLARYIHQQLISVCAHLKPEILHMDMEQALEQISSLELNESVKYSLMSHFDSDILIQVQDECLEKLYMQANYDAVIDCIKKYISALPIKYTHRKNQLLAFKDLVLLRMASERVSSESIACIKQLDCQRLQAHVVISCLHKSRWSVDKCLQILPLCIKRLASSADSFLAPHLQTTFERMSAFHRVMLHANASLDMYSQDTDIDNAESILQNLNPAIVRRLATSWQAVASLLVENPSQVFTLLTEAKEYHIAKRLFDISVRGIKGSYKLKTTVYCSYVLHLLDDNSNHKESEKVLLACRPDGIDRLFSLCIEILDKCQTSASLLFMSSFILNQLYPQLGESRQVEAKLTHIGCQVYKNIDELYKPIYRPLIKQPELLLEQLLMNSQIACASELVKLLFHLNVAEGLCSIEEIKLLLDSFAEKAVEFPLLVYVNQPNSNSTPNRPQTRLQTVACRTSLLASSPVPGTSLGRSPSRLSVHGSYSNLPPVTTAPGNLAMLQEIRSSRGDLGSFIIPDEAPEPKDWVPDNSVSSCMVCETERFSMFARRHHCRRCGRVVCANCSTKSAQVKGINSRVCDDCYDYIFKSGGVSTEKNLSNTNVSSMISQSPLIKSGIVYHDSDSRIWQLTADSERNEEIRNEFFYEHAPSVSLCTSILELYGDTVECANTMLNLCAKLSKIIKPVTPETFNPEVDYNLVISMMKFLLFNAKLIFTKRHHSDGVSICDVYFSRVELLNLLLSQYYLDLPSLDELSNIDNIRLLRDRLLEDERPHIAMDISTRFGLDTTAVWTSWGLSCIRRGEYQSARDKFLKFLKPCTDKNSSTVPFKPVINEIIETIESQTESVCTSNKTKLKSLLISLQSVNSRESISKTIPVKTNEKIAVQLDENQAELQEILYYIKLYGTHQMIVRFYREREFWQKAAQYIIDKQCNNELFIECLLIPALKTDQIVKLQDQLLLLDDRLYKFSTYLSASFVYLSKNKQFQSLYQLQLFVKDYLRAAMFCIHKFYIPGAKTYKGLISREHYLNSAMQHYDSYLEYNQANKQQDTLIDPSLRLIKSSTEVQTYIGKTRLQIQIGKYLKGVPSLSEPHTLYSPSKHIIQLCVNLIILSEPKLQPGFDVAFQVIQMCELNYTQVYCEVVNEMLNCTSLSSVRTLITCIQNSGYSNPELLDTILLHAVKQGLQAKSQSEDIEATIQLINKENSKIEAYIMTGKLKNAYLLAMKRNQVELVHRIAKEAGITNQKAVKVICEKYLKQKGSADSVTS